MGMDCVEVLNPVISEISALNQNDDFPAANLIKPGSASILKSDTDHQLIINLKFQQPVKIAQLYFAAVSEGTAPSEIRLFVNKPNLGFSDAEDAASTQDLLLDAKSNNLTGDKDCKVDLKFVKFQNVNTLTIFVNENIGGDDITELKYLEVWGSKGEASNIADWKPCKS